MKKGTDGKAPVVELRRPKTVLQIFRHKVVYGKGEVASPGGHRELCRWQESFACPAADPESGALPLPQSVFADGDLLGRSDLIVLSERTGGAMPGEKAGLSQAGGSASADLYQLGERSVLSDIFSLRRAADRLEIHLEYSRNRHYIGAPRRGDYLLARLGSDKAVRVSINGKIDFSFSGRMARHYIALDYLFVLLGEFQRLQPLAEGQLPVTRSLALASAKHVDLRKILY
jgi:hypothetical protein